MKRSLRGFVLIVTTSFLFYGVFLASPGQPVRWSIALPITLVILLVYFLLIFFQYRQQLRLLYSVRYEIDGSSIIFHQAAQPALRINRADIVRVESLPNGLRIETVDERLRLLVPAGLARDGDEDLRRTLQTWVGVRSVPDTRSTPKSRRLLIGIAGALLAILFANTLWLILPLGLAFFLFAVWTERRFGQGHDDEPGTQRMVNMAFSFLLFLLIMKACLLTIIFIVAR